MKVAFVFTGSASSGWLGGRNYFRNLFTAISVMAKPQIEIIALTGQQNTTVPFALKSRPVATSMVQPKTLQWFLRYGLRTISSRDWMFETFLRRHDIEVLSHAQHLGKGAAVTTIGWIPDFQHLHLPQFFSEKERRSRDSYYKRLCERCDNVIVSSKTAAQDLQSFLPQCAPKARILQFVSTPEEPRTSASLYELEARYSFTGKYFILPNQFWAHKNHQVVIDALKLLKSRNRDLLVLATGSTKDNRDPNFFPSLLNYIKECGLSDSFRILGVIPYEDLFVLMRNSVAIINPSLFEGWSTSVEEAKSLGKQILLSDIPVHREQSPERGIYFDPASAEDLADKLFECSERFTLETDAGGQAKAAAELFHRQNKFADTYQKIVLEAKISGSRHAVCA